MENGPMMFQLKLGISELSISVGQVVDDLRWDLLLF